MSQEGVVREGKCEEDNAGCNRRIDQGVTEGSGNHQKCRYSCRGGRWRTLWEKKRLKSTSSA